MNTLKLYTYNLEIHSKGALTPAPGELSKWIKTLPVSDAATAAAHLFNLLHQYNQCELEPLVRFEALESLQIAITHSSSALCEKYIHSALPLNERNRQRFHLSSGLFDQMAIGYKTIVLELYNQSANNQKLHELYLKAIHKAIKQLARLLLECYKVYAKEPDDVWGELNQLYQLSETLGANKLVLDNEDNKQTATQTIQYAYLRIALLSVANPYHLMQGEATVLYDYLRKWATGCQLKKVTDYNNLNNNLVVIELKRSHPPHFFYQGRIVDIKNACTIDLSRLLEQFNETLTKMSVYLSSGVTQHTFSERMRRDMFLRIQRVWKERQIRKHHREQTNEYLELATGLATAHHFIHAQCDYTPEQHEVRFYRQDGMDNTLHLHTLDVERSIDFKLPQNTNSEPRETRATDSDLLFWQKLHNHEQNYGAHCDTSIQDHQKYRWMLFNQSENGIGLRRDWGCDSCVNVGDIVSYKKPIDVAGWHIGVVRWVKEFDKHVLELGINIIKGVPRAVSVRNTNTDNVKYFRCLLLELHSRGQSYVTLISPASTLKVGCKILLNTQNQMQYAKISELVTTTTSYSQYEFEIIPIPKNEQIKINTILER